MVAGSGRLHLRGGDGGAVALVIHQGLQVGLPQVEHRRAFVPQGRISDQEAKDLPVVSVIQINVSSAVRRPAEEFVAEAIEQVQVNSSLPEETVCAQCWIWGYPE